MNTIHLCGGLGNQLFQYAFGQAQKRYGFDVQYNIDWYIGKSYQKPQRAYILDKFNIDVPIGFSHGKMIKEEGFDLGLLAKDGFNFYGYWQYPAYCESFLPILRKEILVREEVITKEALGILNEILLDDNSVSVHVRRGDYLQLPDFPVLPLSYYMEALERIEAKGNIYVFSDDMAWCECHFKGVRFVHLNEHLDFELMRWCSNNVISRSTFSWWAAHLNSNPKKIVVAPKQQLECKVRKRLKETSELFDPKEWIKC